MLRSWLWPHRQSHCVESGTLLLCINSIPSVSWNPGCSPRRTGHPIRQEVWAAAPVKQHSKQKPHAQVLGREPCAGHLSVGVVRQHLNFQPVMSMEDGPHTQAFQVFLNIYDVPANGNENMTNVITKINKIGRDLGIGGIFHGAIQIDTYEWSFGWCERGTGVYVVEAQRNPMYTFRETISLGPTVKSKQEIKAILHNLKAEWQGYTYELLSRNCCHFCEALCAQLEVQPLPAWVNRFASSADATVAFTSEAVAMARNVTHTIRSSAVSGFGWIKDSMGKMLQRTSVSGGASGSSPGGSPRHSNHIMRKPSTGPPGPGGMPRSSTSPFHLDEVEEGDGRGWQSMTDLGARSPVRARLSLDRPRSSGTGLGGKDPRGHAAGSRLLRGSLDVARPGGSTYGQHQAAAASSSDEEGGLDQKSLSRQTCLDFSADGSDLKLEVPSGSHDHQHSGQALKLLGKQQVPAVLRDDLIDLSTEFSPPQAAPQPFSATQAGRVADVL